VKVSHFAPGPALAPFVRAYEVVEASGEVERTLVPEASLVLGLRYAGSSWLVEGGSARVVPDAAVTGLRLTARRMRTSAGGGIVLVKFREAGAAPFLEGPLHRLLGETRPLDELVPPVEVERVAGDVRAAPSEAARVAAVGRFLLRCAALRTWRPDPAVEATVRLIRADPGSLRVKAQAAALGLSVDALEKRFRRVVGASPKQLASLLRLRRAVAAHPRTATLGQLAVLAGYYDQAHFNRQWIAALGAAPAAFLTGVEHCME
jgi:methylphosphotriester-DNA--protein-cysteine methyltransferase